ncbi:hypothetical protein [uncultured Roseobacter sp.]|uniref:Cap15 family cyclic dinucleotide receptor domain-containing protein n=1 Tax=Amaricoccus tamworthensis TaxID=57002 RepID=UPI00261CAFAE|nr:hypothetical protein [uncultured Roseobacter sp.]
MREHEYSIVGHSRSRIGLYIAVFSGALASGLTLLVGYAVLRIEAAGYFDVPQLILWPFTAVSIFGILFFLFDRFAWKLFGLKAIVGVPNISGCWALTGQSYDVEQNPTFDWSGKIDITQKYERIFIHLRTETSESHSVSAAIVPEGRAGFRLIYAYRNEPKPGQKELNSHIGHCELLFSPDLCSAEGSYFNSGGRFTHGTMKLERTTEDG